MSSMNERAWPAILERSYLLIRRMTSLSYVSDSVLEGKSDGLKAVEVSKKWLLSCASTEEYYPHLLGGLKEWKDYRLYKLPEFISNQLLIISADILGYHDEIGGLIEYSKNVCNILDLKKTFMINEKADQKIIADLGIQYIEIAKNLMAWYEFNLDSKFKSKEELYNKKTLVPESDYARFKMLESLLYLVGYAGACLIAYKSKHYALRSKKWCGICFRRCKPGGRFCGKHGTKNECKRDHRFGEKVHQVMSEANPMIESDWNNLKRGILDREASEQDLNDNFGMPSHDWRALLVNRISRSEALSSRLDVEVVKSVNNWMGAINYLREKLENMEEKSFHLEAVFSWLAMAENWFCAEDLFLSIDGNQLRSSRSRTSTVPTVNRIIKICERVPGITVSEISKNLELSKPTISRCIKNNEILHKYFPS